MLFLTKAKINNKMLSMIEKKLRLNKLTVVQNKIKLKLKY